MKKNTFGRQLGRSKNQRRALFRSLLTSLIEKSEIVTTSAKAKAIRPDLEKLITKAIRATLADRRQIFRYLGKRDLVNRLVESLGAAFKDRKGGYLRIIRLAARRGDNSEMVKIMLTETPIEKVVTPAEVKPETPVQTKSTEKPKKAKTAPKKATKK